MASNDEKFILRTECVGVKKVLNDKLDKVESALLAVEEAIHKRNNEDARKEGYHEGVIASRADKNKAMARKLKLYLAILAVSLPVVMKVVDVISEVLTK